MLFATSIRNCSYSPGAMFKYGSGFVSELMSIAFSSILSVKRFMSRSIWSASAWQVLITVRHDPVGPGLPQIYAGQDPIELRLFSTWHIQQ